MNDRLSVLSKVLLAISALLLTLSVFVPIWRIELSAPQYPEGLVLKIYSDEIGGDVDIINGLNHYIGMKTLHAKDFVEFSVLNYIIVFYAAMALLTVIANKKRMSSILFILFVLFGIVAMIDFWRWEFNYGHDLDPNAAIVVPGMAYQPPLIGYKQLLNFSAYSIPDIGGWLFVASGMLMLTVILKEYGLSGIIRRKNALLTIVISLPVFLYACNSSGPQAIHFNRDFCNNCRMSIIDQRFACELVTEKGKAYKFDDFICLQEFKRSQAGKVLNASFYISDYVSPHGLFSADKLVYVQGGEIRSPMGGNIAAFSDPDSASAYAGALKAKIIVGSPLNNSF